MGAVVYRQRASAREVLLVRRRVVHGAGHWSTPGGHLEWGEDLEACAVRETTEEAGVESVATGVLGVTNDVFEPEGLHYVTVWVGCRSVGTQEASVCADELDAVAWFPDGALLQPLFAPLRRFLEARPVPSIVADGRVKPPTSSG